MDTRLVTIPSYQVRLEKKVQVAATASLYCFRFEDPGYFRFSAGRYAWLLLDQLITSDPRGSRRAFSIASSHTDKATISFLVRNSESGYKKTLNAMPFGESAQVIGPFGYSFILPQEAKHPVTFIAGGVAIAPLIGIINSYTEKPKIPFRVVHYVADAAQSCKLDQLSLKFKEYGIEIMTCIGPFSGQSLPADIRYPEEHFYISGPQEFVNSVDSFLKRKAVPLEHCHFDEHFPQPIGNLTEETIRAKKENFCVRAIS